MNTDTEITYAIRHASADDAKHTFKQHRYDGFIERPCTCAACASPMKRESAMKWEVVRIG